MVKDKLPSVCFVVAYFGPWPVWMPLFLESCRRNQGFSWLLFGDQTKFVDAPGNVHWERMTLSEFNKLAQVETGLPFAIISPYKICDVKPMFGHIFKRYLKNYQFWGNSDIDLVLGDLNSFGVREALRSCDVYTAFYFPVGHFTLYRNIERVNSLYLKLADLPRAYVETRPPLGFDEKYIETVLNRSRDVRFKRTRDYKVELARNSPAVGATIMPYGQIYGERLSGRERYQWKDGKAFQWNGERRREFMYLHFFMWKGARYWRLYDGNSRPKEFWLDASGYGSNTRELMSISLVARIGRFSQFLLSRVWYGLRWTFVLYIWRKFLA